MQKPSLSLIMKFGPPSARLKHVDGGIVNTHPPKHGDHAQDLDNDGNITVASVETRGTSATLSQPSHAPNELNFDELSVTSHNTGTDRKSEATDNVSTVKTSDESSDSAPRSETSSVEGRAQGEDPTSDNGSEDDLPPIVQVQSKYELGIRLLNAARVGNLLEVGSVVNQGADVNYSERRGETALHESAFNGHLRVTELLIDQGADPNLKNDLGETSLHYAATRGNNEIIPMLLEAGARINIKDMLGQPALYYAVIYNHTEVIHALLSAGADPRLYNHEGVPLHRLGADPPMRDFLKRAWSNYETALKNNPAMKKTG